jgi:hypothetical protein
LLVAWRGFPVSDVSRRSVVAQSLKVSLTVM